jgi:guanylate kinase
VQQLLPRHPELEISISVTTRSPRAGEFEGREYYFVNKEEFQRMIQENKLLEWAEYAGNYYGTPRNKVEEQIQQGKSIILEIDVVGARQIKQTFPDALLIFILPPSESELENRLRGRGNDSEDAIAKRLAKARGEIAARVEFDRQIVNDDLKIALEAIETAIFHL